MPRRTKSRRPKGPTLKDLMDPDEDTIQKEVVRQLRARGYRFFHCPNERKATYAQRQWLRDMGLSSGVPDLILMPHSPGGPTCALELKKAGARPTPAQREWLAAMADAGWVAGWAAGRDAVLAQLRAWGYDVG